MKKIILFVFYIFVFNVFSQESLFIHDDETAHIGPFTYVCVFGDLEADTITSVANSGFLIMKGDSMQKLKLNSISKIQFENPKGFLLVGRNLVVNDSIEMISGIINTQSNYLGLAHNGKLSNTISNAIHVNGFFRKIGNTAFTFPVGNGTLYAPISISAPANTTDHFTGSYYHTSPSAASYDRTIKDLILSNVSACEYWILDRTNGSSDVQVTLSWDSRSCGVTDLSKLRVSRWNGTQWKDHDNTATTGNASSGTITSNLVSSFSPFTLASISTINSLPVELTSFEALCQDEYVDLKWSTASEKNNDYFIVQKSENGQDWIDLIIIKGNGTTATAHDYNYRDYQKSNQKAYYRLADVSTDKITSYSQITSSKCNQNLVFESEVFPSLANDYIAININKLDVNASYKIIDLLGGIIRAGILDKIHTRLDIHDLSSGFYFLQISTNESNSIVKFEKLSY
jgi:hypothetical protein